MAKKRAAKRDVRITEQRKLEARMVDLLATKLQPLMVDREARIVGAITANLLPSMVKAFTVAIEAFYERRDATTIDREVNKQLKAALADVLDRVAAPAE